jgi:hypothetical protein
MTQNYDGISGWLFTDHTLQTFTPSVVSSMEGLFIPIDLAQPPLQHFKWLYAVSVWAKALGPAAGRSRGL